MRWTRLALLLCAAAALATPRAADAQTVDLSVNVFPTNLALPNNGGTWNMVAKTSGGSTNIGIAGISIFLRDVNIAGLMLEPDVNSITQPGGGPYAGIFAGAVNILYGQDLSIAPIVAGVGTPTFSDGPDPLGSAFWNGATKIFKGTYSAVVPTFSMAVGQIAQANVLVSTTPGTAAIAATTVTTVVRVQVPEPATAVIAAMSLLGVVALRRRMYQR
jgi:hypothetical protein